MGALQVTVVTAEREVFSGEADVVIVPGAEGELAILPSHTPLVTVMNPGELWIQDGDKEDALALSGGFMEVRNNQISILADTAERPKRSTRPAPKPPAKGRNSLYANVRPILTPQRSPPQSASPRSGLRSPGAVAGAAGNLEGISGAARNRWRPSALWRSCC